MKSFALFLSLAAVSWAADFQTGQAARFVIGQPTFSSQDSRSNVGDPTTISSDPNVPRPLLGGVGQISFANGVLVVADANRVGANPVDNRVLIYRNILSQLVSQYNAIPSGAARCPLCGGKADVVLGQPDFTTTTINLTQSGLRTPTAAATDGTHVVVADTDNNRVLIWNTLPSSNGQPADLVLGQPDFTHNVPSLTQTGFRAPQGLWIQGSRLYVADTGNNRVLVWNSFPTKNNQPADLVLGEPNFTTSNQPDLYHPENSARPNNMFSPVSVSSDGTRLYVTDLGFNRVLVWNSIPTSNQTPADLAIGQLDLSHGLANDNTHLCASNGTDPNNNNAPTYPARCGATLNYPRSAIANGSYLFIADGGNDRVLVYKTIPTTSGKSADYILGQPDEFTDQVDDFLNSSADSAADVLRTPMSLASDGTNLYVADTFNRRILVYTPGDFSLPYNGVRNAASQDVYAIGTLDFSGKITANDTLTIQIGDSGAKYSYTVTANDTLATVIAQFVKQINSAPDPLVLAVADPTVNRIILTARQAGAPGSTINLTVTPSSNATITATATNPAINLLNPAQVAPGSYVTLTANNLTDQPAAAADPSATLPDTLAGVQVYFDGLRAPMLYASPTQINFQVPWEVNDATSVSMYVRVQRKDGTVQVSNPIGVPIVPGNPGIFALPGTEPRVALAYHATSYASGSILLTGTTTANDTVTVTVENRSYTYTVQSGDTLDTVRDALIALINAAADERVTAQPAGQYDRILLYAKVPGPDGNGVSFGASASGSATEVLSPNANALCCANQAGAPVTPDNPAVAGEQIYVLASGLGLIGPRTGDNPPLYNLFTFQPYNGPALNNAATPVDDAQVGGSTANVLSASLIKGTTGTYKVVLELSNAIASNPLTSAVIFQGLQGSNIVTIPVVNPNPPSQ